MTELVPSEEIEALVGAHRHGSVHLGRAVNATQTVYILHSRECVDSGGDLRECSYSKALDVGIDVTVWRGEEDRCVVLGLRCDGHDVRLVPAYASPQSFGVALLDEEG
jgi:hypothetical protein|nr:MAG TPA: hypothetical protein [Caudoviricetes sp.]